MTIVKTILLIAILSAIGIALVNREARHVRDVCELRYPEAVECIVVSGPSGFEGIPIWRP